MRECSELIFREFYSVQTPPDSPRFFDCLWLVLGTQKLEYVLKLSQTQYIKDAVKADSAAAVTKYGTFGLPWMVATRLSDGKRDVFFGSDKVEDLGWFLGSEYVWRGPYADGVLNPSSGLQVPPVQHAPFEVGRREDGSDRQTIASPRL